MMLARVRSSSLHGAGAMPVDVEVKVRKGKTRNFSIIGLADNAVKESRERVTSALRASGFGVPNEILVNLAPAELKKEGAAFDLAIAVGILIASGQLEIQELSTSHFVGELSLDGRAKPLGAAVAHGVSALSSGAKDLVMPAVPNNTAYLVSELRIIEINSLLQMVQYLRDGKVTDQPNNEVSQKPYAYPDIAEVHGQREAKRALLIAAAGGHNVLFVGPPGCGKSMLAKRYPGILPGLSRKEMLEVARIHSVVGTPLSGIMQGQRPFRSPHHVVSEAGLIGGGAMPRPGEISLAHKGVLFLDEFPEFKRSVIEALRAPLESGSVTVTRARATVDYPADFQLIAAMNPCPCGRLGVVGLECSCSRSALSAYLRKLSQPILDRIDLQVHLDAIDVEDLTKSAMRGAEVESADLRKQVELARGKGVERSGTINALLNNKQALNSSELTPDAMKVLERVSRKGLLSARKYFRTIKVARTVADLDQSKRVHERHVAEALSYRCLDKIEAFAQGGGS